MALHVYSQNSIGNLASKSWSEFKVKQVIQDQWSPKVWIQIKRGFQTETEFLDEIQTKVLRVFLHAVHSRHSFALRLYFFKLTQPLPISTVHLLYTVKEKGGKPDRKPYPVSYGLGNPYRNLKSENNQDSGQKL